MKKVFLIISIGCFLLSCAKDITIKDSESTSIAAFQSAEFKALQTSYDSYLEVEQSVVQVFEEKEKWTTEEFETRKNDYVQKISEKMFEAKRKRDAFLSKYPIVGEEMTTKELSDLLRAENK